MRGFYFARKMENGEPVIEDGKEVQAFPDAQLPIYATKKSAGADMCCAEDVKIPSVWLNLIRCIKTNMVGGVGLDEKHPRLADCFKPILVHTGIKANMEDDEVLELYNRSSNPRGRGLLLANGVGVIDADYFENPSNDGEIMFMFWNFSIFDSEIKTGDRIGQCVFKKFLRPVDGLVVKDNDRKGGIGSTGR